MQNSYILNFYFTQSTIIYIKISKPEIVHVFTLHLPSSGLPLLNMHDWK